MSISAIFRSTPSTVTLALPIIPSLTTERREAGWKRKSNRSSPTSLARTPCTTWRVSAAGPGVRVDHSVFGGQTSTTSRSILLSVRQSRRLPLKYLLPMVLEEFNCLNAYRVSSINKSSHALRQP